MARPVIGVTGPDAGGLSAWWFSALGVRLAGGRPVRITPRRGRPSHLDGVVIGGGTDVDPSLYGEVPLEEPPGSFQDAGTTFVERIAGVLIGVLRVLLSTRSPKSVDPARDELESEVIRYAIETGVPIIAICRGMQLLNVILGGDLIQDVRPIYQEHAYVRSVFPRKRVRILAGSRLADILGVSECRVNALHRQAVRKLGKGLVAVAHEPSGVVQAIERSAGPLVLGLQWHPEWLPQIERQRRLFTALVATARSGVSELSAPMEVEKSL